MQEKKTFRDTFLRVVALLGVILVLLLGAWGIILLAFNLSSIVAGIGGNLTSLVAGVGSPTGEALTVTTPASPITSGQSLPISWKHTGQDGEYSYTLSYACAVGLSMQAPTPAGKSQTVVCNTPFNYTNAASAMSLVAQNSTKQAVKATITVLATRLSDGAVTASASADATINPAAAAAPATSASNSTYVPATRVATLYGYSDLVVRVISVNAASGYGRTTAQFEVANAGTNVAPAGWNFEADLPMNPTYRYTSPVQQALYPGDKIVYTLTFDNQQYQNCGNYSGYNYDYDDCGNSYNTGNRVLTIIADPYNYVRESNEGNNTVSTQVYNY